MDLALAPCPAFHCNVTVYRFYTKSCIAYAASRNKVTAGKLFVKIYCKESRGNACSACETTELLKCNAVLILFWWTIASRFSLHQVSSSFIMFTKETFLRSLQLNLNFCEAVSTIISASLWIQNSVRLHQTLKKLDAVVLYILKWARVWCNALGLSITRLKDINVGCATESSHVTSQRREAIAIRWKALTVVAGWKLSGRICRPIRLHGSRF